MIAATDDRCWQCGGRAGTKSAYSLRLVADSRRQLQTFGYPVDRGTRLDKLRVSVPRCVRCQALAQFSIVIVLCGALAGAIIAPRSGPAAVVGGVAGFAVALVGVSLARRALHLRSVMDYP